MARKRGSMEQSYTAGFVPYSWFVIVKSANKAVVDDLGFFWPHDQDRRNEAWSEVDSSETYKRLISTDRPTCGFCGGVSIAKFGAFGQLCLECDAYRNKGEKVWDREHPSVVNDLTPLKQVLKKAVYYDVPVSKPRVMERPVEKPIIAKPNLPLPPGAKPKRENTSGVIRWDLMGSLKPKNW